MPSHPVPSGDGYADVSLGQAQGKPVKSIHFYQDEEALNIAILSSRTSRCWR